MFLKRIRLHRIAHVTEFLCMQRVNQAVSSVSPHLAPEDLQSDSSAAAASNPADAPLTNVRQLYNEVFLPSMRQHLQAPVHSDTSVSQKPGAVKKVRTSHPAIIADNACAVV